MPCSPHGWRNATKKMWEGEIAVSVYWLHEEPATEAPVPLDDREQKILEEIEKQFYADDPKLAQTVAKTTLESVSQRWTPVAVGAFVVGVIIMLAFFRSQVLVAGAGFVVMVISAGWIAMDLRRRTTSPGTGGAVESWISRARQRWQRDG